MERNSTLLLRGAIAAMGIGVLTLCYFALRTAIIEDIGGYSLILFWMCVTAIPFFIALYQTLKLLHYIDHNKAFSDLSVTALKNIKYSALTISIMYALGLPYTYTVADRDDAPGVIVIGMVLTAAPFVIAVFASVLQKLLQNALDIKAENDLTV